MTSGDGTKLTEWRATIVAPIRAILALVLGDFCHWVLRSPSTPKPRIPIPQGQYPSLDRAFARVSRGEEHLADCVRQLGRRGKKQLDAITFDADQNHPKQIVVDKPELPLDFTFSILIGEIIYNLRAALDYLIFELAALDSGCVIEGTQFPIESNKKGFKSCVRRGWLEGLNATHIALIEGLQPYRGNAWAAALKNLSNPDKHRALTPSQVEHEFTFHIADRDHIADFSDIPGAIRTAVTADGTEVYIKAVLLSAVQFRDGTPVIETLEEIKSQIARVLETFKPDFQQCAVAVTVAPSVTP